MKRLTLIIIGVLLCTPLYSDMNTYIAGVPVSGGGGDCPAGTTFYWDGDHSSGNLYACDANGDAILGTNVDGTLSTDCGVGGSVGVCFSTKDDYIGYTVTAAEIGSDEGTLWVEVYIDENNTSDTAFFEVVNSSAYATSQMFMKYYTSGNLVRCERTGGGANDSVARSLTKGSFTTIGLSWSVGREGADFAATNSSGGTWTEESDGIASMGEDIINTIRLGNLNPTSYDNQAYRINRVAVVPGWEGACPW